jgi:hypothetical protein
MAVICSGWLTFQSGRSRRINSRAEVFEQGRRLKKIHDYNSFGSVVIEVPHGNAAGRVPG